MNDDDRYLWDGSGPPDPEIERLERALAPLRTPLILADVPQAPPRRRRWTAAAGALAAAAVGLLIYRVTSLPARGPENNQVNAPMPAMSGTSATTGWPLRVATGTARIGTRLVTGDLYLQAGEVLETPEATPAQLQVPELGSVQVDPHTRVALVDAGDRQHRLRLERGSLQVTIFAPPGKFFVETPAGLAVDLGCAYTVHVDAAGNGYLHVSSGWVGFQLDQRESLIPAGAECGLRAGHGPGTPRFADASVHFRRAVTALDNANASAGAGAEQEAFALATVLSQARPRDAFTLWHLLDRLPVEARPSVLRRLVTLVPAAGAVPRQRILAGDRQALDQLWDTLGLEPIAHWRRWKADPGQR